MSDPHVTRGDAKQSVRVATTADITLSGLQTVDGVALAANDRVLVKNQTNATENGLWQVKAGAWNRTADADNSGEMTAGMLVLPTEGSQAFKQFVLITPDPITIGVTSLTFQQVSGDVEYVHVQGSASATWTINHGLGKYPSVTLLDATNTEVIADIQHLSVSSCEVSFSSPQTGTAFFN